MDDYKLDVSTKIKMPKPLELTPEQWGAVKLFLQWTSQASLINRFIFKNISYDEETKTVTISGVDGNELDRLKADTLD